MTERPPPKPYEPHFRQSGFTDPWEPLYSAVLDDEVSIGVWLRDAHCNSRGFAHGGLIASIADNAMGLSCGAVLRGAGREDISGLVTVTLNTDFIGSGQVGAWLATHTRVEKAGGSLCFASCVLRADDEPIAKANATFKVLTKKD